MPKNVRCVQVFEQPNRRKSQNGTIRRHQTNVFDSARLCRFDVTAARIAFPRFVRRRERIRTDDRDVAHLPSAKITHVIIETVAERRCSDSSQNIALTFAVMGARFCMLDSPSFALKLLRNGLIHWEDSARQIL